MARQSATSAKPATSAVAKKKAAPTNKPQAQPAGPLARPEGRTKFTLYNLLGQPRAYYVVDAEELKRPPVDPKAKQLAHSIIVVDRSGSMYGSINDLKDHLLKLLTLDEYGQFNLIVTLISYSGEGDARVHFQRAPIKEIMKRGSKYQDEIKKIQITGSTCISGGLRLADSLAKDSELTAVTLHSDGYANDPSPNAEQTALMQLARGMQDKDVFVNTIAYSDYSDFRLLSRVANTVSGSCVKAGDTKAVYDTLYSSTKLLGSSLVPPVEVPLGKGHDFQVFVSHAAGKVNGAAGQLKVIGIKPDHDAVVYKYRKVDEKEYKALKDVPEQQTSEAVFAFSKAQLAEGNLNTAKYALGSTYDATLVDRHAKALTNKQVADLAQDLDNLLFNPGQLQEHEVLTEVPVNKRAPVVLVVKILEEHGGEWLLNLPYLQEHYVRRGLKRLQGTRDDGGKLIEPTLKTEFIDPDEYVRVSGFEVNRNSATLNMLITRRVRLVDRATGKPVTQVAGILLDKLMSYNNYTLVGDGELNIDKLKVKINSKKLFEELWQAGVLENEDGTPAGKFDPDAAYLVRLDNLPLVPPFSGKVDLSGVFDELTRLKVMASLVSAHLKEEAAEYTPEQVEALKKHYLSKNLYINFPTTNPYTDLKQAIAEGSVDTRTSYKIDVGNREIVNLSKLHSANKALERLYEVMTSGQQVDKPKFEDALNGDWTYRHKQLSAKTKVTKVDELMKRMFDDFLGLQANGSAASVLEEVGAKDLAKIVKERAKGKQPGRKAFVEALADARKKLEARQEAIFREKLAPLVFYVGATGLLPDEVEAKALTADQVTAKYPELALSKDEKEGTFFEIGDTILTVYAKTEYFSRDVEK
jgi:Mg-chelatase subunit ChlD